VVTNDFPPRVGGVQQYVGNLVRRLPPDRVAVLAPNWTGWREHDRDQPYPVHRWPATVLLPSDDLARRCRDLVRAHDADLVLFGHGFPVPVLAPRLLEAGIPSVILTHGAELWFARMPGTSAAMQRSFGAARAVTGVSEFVARALRPLIPATVPFTLLPPAVDPDRFRPDSNTAEIRARHGLGERPVVLCVSRLVPRKGQDTLIRAMPIVTRLVPDAALLIAGDGPDRPRLDALAEHAPAGSVVFAGEVPDAELPAHYAVADVFAMPCRSRFGGLEVEGFGIVFLEAAAAGRAVVAGRSGGAAEAVLDEETGLLVEGREPKAVALAIARLLLDPPLRERMGAAGRSRVEREFTWDRRTEQLTEILTKAV
jgi:phosphatidylinositol alpha-1,6-mannosyltransferase